jgi:hypothetical protein
LLSAAQNLVVVFKTSGSADQNAGPHDLSLSWRAPILIYLWLVGITRRASALTTRVFKSLIAPGRALYPEPPSGLEASN